MLYTMKRTQIYLDEPLWRDLKNRARQRGITVSDLIRQSLKLLYPTPVGERRKAMEALVGIWRDRTDLPETEEYVRAMRRDTRAKRLGLCS